MIIIDQQADDMLEVRSGDGICYFHGNIWDFDKVGSLAYILACLGHKVKVLDTTDIERPEEEELSIDFDY